MDRKSKLSKNDCLLLLRRMQKVEEKLMKFAMDGFPEKGFSDDQNLCVELLYLGDFIDEKVRTKKNGTELS